MYKLLNGNLTVFLESIHKMSNVFKFQPRLYYQNGNILIISDL